MSAVVNVYDAKTNLSRLLERASAGEEILIARAGKPIARLVPLAPMVPQAPRKPRVGGQLAGLTIPDEFFAPLSEAELADWE